MKKVIKNIIKNVVLLFAIVSALISIANLFVWLFSRIREHLPAGGGKYFNWKYGQIYYTKTGHGKPLLLVHDLDATSSSYEWHRIIKKQACTNTVYAIDLLGCGRSQKPNLTYTNYLYVQLINDFIRTVIGEKADVVATADAFPLVVMACQMEPERFNKLIGITPADLYDLTKSPNRQRNLLKFVMELPVIGTFIYNTAVSRQKIRARMVNRYFYKGYLVSPQIIDNYYQAAHTGNGSGKYLLASIKSCYTNINIIPALEKINNSICLIGGKEHPFIADIISDYKSCNPAIEDASIAGVCCFPQLEAPEKLVQLLNIIIHS